MPILECTNLTKNYGPNRALDGASFTVGAGRIVGLLGPNGSGKTTTIKLAAGLLTPSSGEIRIAGHRPDAYTKGLVSYLPERCCFPDWMRTEQALGYYQDFYPDFCRPRAEEMLDRLGISRKMRIRQMSKGTREKLQLILVMGRDAALYLLDEPMGGVDPATRDFILGTIVTNYNPQSTILISTHLISDVEPILDDAIFIRDGKVLLQKSVDEIRQEHGMSVDATFREVFRCSPN